MELYLIRHGESMGNVVTYDVPDGVLTPKGEQQARQLALAMRTIELTHIISSPLKRALQTASCIAQEHGLRITVWKQTRECRALGTYIGPPMEELRSLFPHADFPDDMETDGWVYEGMESPEAGLQRAYEIAERLRSEFDDTARVAMIAHGGFNQMLLRAFLGMNDPRRVIFEQGNTGVNHLKVDGDQVRLAKVNDLSHLVAVASLDAS